jgi:hypothetical protein
VRVDLHEDRSVFTLEQGDLIVFDCSGNTLLLTEEEPEVTVEVERGSVRPSEPT